jgi:hypothetical protein
MQTRLFRTCSLRQLTYLVHHGEHVAGRFVCLCITLSLFFNLAGTGASRVGSLCYHYNEESHHRS